MPHFAQTFPEFSRVENPPIAIVGGGYPLLYLPPSTALRLYPILTPTFKYLPRSMQTWASYNEVTAVYRFRMHNPHPRICHLPEGVKTLRTQDISALSDWCRSVRTELHPDRSKACNRPLTV